MTLAWWLAERNVKMKEVGRCVKLVELQLWVRALGICSSDPARNNIKMPEQQDSIPMVPQSTFMSTLPSLRTLFMMRLQIGLQVS